MNSKPQNKKKNKKQAVSTFAAIGLCDPIQRALAEEGYEVPTPIQAQTIPPANEGLDILGCAQTGTGKTAAFSLPILEFIHQEKLVAHSKRPLALILAPTRELAIQIGESFAVYGRHISFNHALVYGGVRQGEQVRQLRKGVEVLVATPGRLIDLIEQGHISLQDIEVFVLDEADRMLDMGFLPALKRIIGMLPEERQSLFFSATVPPKIRNLAADLLFNPVSIDVTPKQTSVKKIKQTVRMLDRSKKFKSLCTILNKDTVDQAIVFTRTKHGANGVVRKLTKAGIQSSAIHGNKSQGARQSALDAFRKNRISVLVATDIAARGIDIDGVTHVINYDMPVEAESYVHRIGRTGRAGAAGTAISFCTVDEKDKLKAIEKLIGQPLKIGNPGEKQTDESSEDPAPRKRFRHSRGGQSRGPSRPKRAKGSTAGRSKNSQASGAKATSDGKSGNNKNRRRKNSKKKAATASGRSNQKQKQKA